VQLVVDPAHYKCYITCVISKKNSFLLVSLIFSSTNILYAGHETSGGGDAVRCPKKLIFYPELVQEFDIPDRYAIGYGGDILAELVPILNFYRMDKFLFGQVKRSDAQLLIVNALNKYSPGLGHRLLQRSKNLKRFTQQSLLNDRNLLLSKSERDLILKYKFLQAPDLPNLPDEIPEFVTIGKTLCKKTQLAFQLPNRNAYITDDYTFAKLTSFEKELLTFHEALINEQYYSKQEMNSAKVREVLFTALIEDNIDQKMREHLSQEKITMSLLGQTIGITLSPDRYRFNSIQPREVLNNGNATSLDYLKKANNKSYFPLILAEMIINAGLCPESLWKGRAREFAVELKTKIDRFIAQNNKRKDDLDLLMKPDELLPDECLRGIPHTDPVKDPWDNWNHWTK
jgi:hypothetical protein